MPEESKDHRLPSTASDECVSMAAPKYAAVSQLLCSPPMLGVWFCCFPTAIPSKGKKLTQIEIVVQFCMRKKQLTMSHWGEGFLSLLMT